MPIEAEIEGYGILEFPDGTSEDVIQSVVKRTLSERSQSQPTASPATIADMRRREEQPGFGQPIPQSEEPDQGPAQFGQPFPLANRPQSPVGSIEQLNLAVEQSANIGRIGRTNFNFSQQEPPVDQNKTPVDFNDPKFENKDLLKESLILGPQSAAKLQARREQKYGSMPPAGPGQYVFSRPAPESDLSPEEAAYLSKERSGKARQYAGTAVRYGVPVGVGLATGGLGPLAAYGLTGAANVASEAGAEMLQDGELNYGNILGSAANIPSYGKISSSSANPIRKGIESALNIFNEEISGSKFKTLLKSGLKGATESGVQASIENSLSDAQNQQSVLERALKGGIVNPALGGAFKVLGAGYRTAIGGDPSVLKFLGQLNRPFVQQTLKNRSDELAKTFKANPGIDLRYTDDLAKMFYSPEIHATDESVQAFGKRLQDFIVASVITGRRAGLTPADLAKEISETLNKTAIKVGDQGDLLIESITRDLTTAHSALQDNIDNRLKKNPELKNLINEARNFEGRKSTEIVAEETTIANLRREQADLSNTDVVESNRLSNEINAAEQRKLKFEQDDLTFKGRQPAGAYGTGVKLKDLIGLEYKDFKADQTKGWDGLKKRWANITVTIDKVDPDGNPVFVKDKVTGKATDVVEKETFTFDQIKQKRTDILARFDFQSTIQQGSFPQYEQLRKQNDLITKALENDLDVASDLKIQNASFAKGIKRFQPSHIQKLTREEGWAEGTPETLDKIISSRGPTYLNELKNALGGRYSEGKKDLSDYIFNQQISKVKNPEEFVNQLLLSQQGVGSANLSQEVAKEFFPDLDIYKIVAGKYKDEIASIASLKNEISQKEIGVKEASKDIEGGIVGSQKRKDEIEKEISDYKKELQTKENKIAGELKQTGEESKALSKLIALQTSIKNGSGNFKFKNTDFEFIQRNSANAKDLIDNLTKYVDFQNSESTVFAKRVKDLIGIAGGGARFEGSDFPPESMVDHIMGTLKSKNPADGRRIMNLMTPELQEDVKALFTSKLLQEVTDGKKIDTKKLRTLISANVKDNDFYGAAELFLGQKGITQLKTIATQLDTFQPDNVIAENILYLLGGGGAAALSYFTDQAVVSGIAASSLTAFGAYRAKKQIFNVLDKFRAYTIDKALKNPDYVKAASAPIDQLTSEQIKKYENYIPRLMKLAYDKWQIADDFEVIKEVEKTDIAF